MVAHNSDAVRKLSDLNVEVKGPKRTTVILSLKLKDKKKKKIQQFLHEWAPNLHFTVTQRMFQFLEGHSSDK